ncbi:UV-endonuclease UvdE-domain-containing protein [Apiospora arundinis]|uniref:UV-endonuclease UvdE-domain-containing protein n=1 Tax=Apiospora arundinis TaxID=335852 RepID=A0ABR2IJI8_9PEZI
MSGLTPDSFRGASIAMMITASVIVDARTTTMIQNGLGIHWDGVWLATGYVLFMIVSGVYVGSTELFFRINDTFEGRAGPYPGIADDKFSMKKILLFTSPGLWFTLWSIKFSLLALYKRLLIQVPLYTRLWWGVVVFSVLSLAASLAMHITTCEPVTNWLQRGGCGENNQWHSYVSIWQAYSVDATTDLMVMLLPLGLIRNLHMPTTRKLSLVFLFCLGTFVIIAATIRVAQLGKAKNSNPSPAWLALWSNIESSVAVIVGCGPGLYRKAKSIGKSQGPHAYENEEYSNTKMGQSSERSIRNKMHSPATTSIPLTTYSVASARATKTVNGGDSEEDLVRKEPNGSITVTKSDLVCNQA